ncbi:MAG: hypothetical protein M1817_004339 [Caeruleum heppii]|nr:MAG: hypothetical protein M1817_004339 [Caeruleum heppii]
MSPSHQELHTLSSTGELDQIRRFFEVDIYSLPQEQRSEYCRHSSTCDEVPCTSEVENLADAATQHAQEKVFAYLYDAFLGPRGVKISWRSLYAAMRLGSIPLADVFLAREPKCFTVPPPRAVHGRHGTLLNAAMRQEHLDLVDHLVAHGLDINLLYPSQSPLRMVIRLDIDDDTCLRRTKFLIERGARMNGCGALRVASAYGRLAVVRYLLDQGAEVDENDEVEELNTAGSTSLIDAAGAGQRAVVGLLLQHGADITYVNRDGDTALTIAEKNHHDEVVRILKD